MWLWPLCQIPKYKIKNFKKGFKVYKEFLISTNYGTQTKYPALHEIFCPIAGNLKEKMELIKKNVILLFKV